MCRKSESRRDIEKILYLDPDISDNVGVDWCSACWGIKLALSQYGKFLLRKAGIDIPQQFDKIRARLTLET